MRSCHMIYCNACGPSQPGMIVNTSLNPSTQHAVCAACAASDGSAGSCLCLIQTTPFNIHVFLIATLVLPFMMMKLKCR